MSWLSAASGTLIVAYLLTVLIVGRLAKQTEARQTETRQTVDSKASTDTASDIRPVKSSTTADKPSASSAPLSQPPTTTTTTTTSPSPVRPQLARDTSLMAPPPPPQPPPSPPTVRSTSPPRLKPPAMSAPPRPGNGLMRPPPPSAAASLRVPQTKVLSTTHMQPGSSTLGVPSKKRSRQVTLGPGYSPLDWAALTSNPDSGLRGKDAADHFMRVTPSRLRKQTGRKGKDAWTVYQGKVYNITPYLPFHPGGAAELLKGAGRDAGALFMEVHPWVNWDGMLAECLVGILVAEDDGDANATNKLDEMD